MTNPLDLLDRRLSWLCDYHWGQWPAPCRHPVRWRICAFTLDTLRTVRGWVS